MEPLNIDQMERSEDTGDRVRTGKDRSGIKKAVGAGLLLVAVLMTGFGLGLNNAGNLTGSDMTARLLTPKLNLASDSTTLDQASGQNSVAAIVEKIGAAVVTIETESYQTVRSGRMDLYGRMFGPTNRQQTVPGLGSGFIITADGYLLTNYHVIEGTDSIMVKLLGSDDRYEAQVVGYDAEQDLAVLKIEAGQQLPAVTLGDSDSASAGDWAIAIGNPYGLDHTVTLGVISAKERPMTVEGQSYKSLLQTDASINPGNSGGPLLNIKGEVIGINTAVNAEGQGLGFAIPINTARTVLQDLIAQGEMSTLQ